MKYRFPMPSLLAALVILAAAVAPFAHRAWGHEKICAHASCASASAGTTARISTCDPCDTCAWLGTLQPPSMPLPAPCAISAASDSIEADALDATRADAPDLTSGGARAPPR